MKRTRLENSCCPVARSLDVIGDWWSLLIVRDALRGVRRFSEFQKNLGIAKNMLAGRLKMLVDEGILRLQLIDRQQRQPLRKLVLQAADGRELAPTDITIAVPLND